MILVDEQERLDMNFRCTNLFSKSLMNRCLIEAFPPNVLLAVDVLPGSSPLAD